MSVVRQVKRNLAVVFAMTLLAALVGASPALAEPSWWHLNSSSEPAVLQPGQAKEEALEITVSATGGNYVIEDTENEGAAVFNWNDTDQEMQTGLEEMYGAGNVEVTGGPGDETGSKPYTVTFKNQLGFKRVALPNIYSSFFGLFELKCEGAVGSGCMHEAKAKLVSSGSTDGQIVVTAANMGQAALSGTETPITITDKLPAGLTAIAIKGESDPGLQANRHPLNCSLASLSCTFNEKIPPYEELRIEIAVNLKPGAKAGEANEVLASGGSALPVKYSRPLRIGGTTTFGVDTFEMTPEEEGGAIDTQAGSHPFQFTTNLGLNREHESLFCSNSSHCTEESNTPEAVKDLNFKLPPGLIGNPTPFPQCRLSSFLKSETFTNECPNDTAVGVAHIKFYLGLTGETAVTVPLFNLTPSTGEPARFGFLALSVPVYLDTAVRTGSDYGVTVSVDNITQIASLMESRVTLWGVPGDKRHDSSRGWSCIDEGGLAGPQNNKPRVLPCAATGELTPPPLMEMPTSCTGPLQATVEAESWTNEGNFTSFEPNVPMTAMDGCNVVPFTPSVSVAPDSHDGSTPSGLTVALHVPQEVSLDPKGLGEAEVKDTTVALPEGVALNPAAADGLMSCTEAQIGLHVDAVPDCPEAAKVGTLEIKTPLLPNPLVGDAYLAAQNANPFGSLVALYFVAQDPVSGTLIKVAGEVKPDPVTGQLVSTFLNTPQLPFEEFKLHFFGGSRAPLGAPALCGSYTTDTSMAPWSGNPPSTSTSTFDITSGPNGSPCSDPLPFVPQLTAGSTNIQTGAFSTFTMTMSREDGNQNLKAVQLKMPPGLLGTLATVKLCGEAEANAGTCGPESLIGETVVSVGLGSTPFSVTGGKVYITGPYHGAPYGLSIVNPAKAGPFDLGNVIVRAKIEVDPITAALTVTTDTSGPYAIPQILDGIPLQIKHINVSISRPDFTFNPTNCTPTAITGSLTSSENATDALSVPFQVTNCATLAFKPQFKVSTAGKTSRTNGASLAVKLSYPKAAWGTQANIKSVKVDLPRQLPSRLTTLQKACTAAVFDANPADCPADSRIGSATATTPIIPVSLAGPAYFVSYGGAKFPELVIVLSGYGVTVYLHGETFISPAGITSSTFRTIPDVPIGTFELKLPQGPFSALGANKNLCTVKGGLKMPTVFTAQNGLVIHQSTPIGVTGCPKAKAKAKAGKAHKGAKKKK
ncbi:MAG TPA: hypothetical protein VIJ50_12620 [Solirubrobacteraceae bacterium]